MRVVKSVVFTVAVNSGIKLVIPRHLHCAGFCQQLSSLAACLLNLWENLIAVSARQNIWKLTKNQTLTEKNLVQEKSQIWVSIGV